MKRKLLLVAAGLVVAFAGEAPVRAESASATVVVKVPAQARVFFDGDPIPQTGTVRTCTTPRKLQP